MDLPREAIPNNPLNNPITPQDIICHIVHIPIPNNILDRNVVKIARIIAATGPKNMPHIIINDVTGWTPGRNVKKTRPTTASAANNASSVNL